MNRRFSNPSDHNRRRSQCSRRIALLTALLCGVLMLAAPFPAIGQETGCAINQVVVGIDGHYRVGRMTQVSIEVDSKTPQSNVRLEVTLPDGEGVRSVNSSTVDLKAGSNQLRAIVKFGRVEGDLAVRLLDEQDQVLAEQSISSEQLPDAVLGSQNLVLTLGQDIEVDRVLATRREKPGQETVQAVVSEATALPTHWLGYRGASLIVLPASSEGLVGDMTAAQVAALDRWVRMGGRLLLSCGAQAEKFLAAGGPLASLIPGEFDRLQMQRQSSSLENFAGTTSRPLSSFVAEGELSFRIPMALLKETDGRVLVSEGIGRAQSPMIVRSSHGFGHVQFIATDLDVPPVSQWTDGRRQILGTLIDDALLFSRRDDSDSQFAGLTQIGFDDLTGQLRASMDQFEGIRLVPFSWIAILVGLYVLIIGPIDYLLLRRMRQSFGATWITFPLVVAAACGLAWWLTQYWKGHDLRVNQVDIVDIDSESGLLRGTTWAHLFSPTSHKYDLSMQSGEILPVSEPMGHLASWQGLPGKSFGGMNNTRVAPDDLAYTIETAANSGDNQSMQIRGLPIDIYASRSLAGLTWGQVNLPAADKLTANSDNQLMGRVQNPLDVELKNPRLCFGRRVYPLPTLAPGGSVEIDRSSRVKTIDGMLTRMQVDQDFKGRSEPWDRKSLDTNRIMEMMMFHESAGGSKYTSLLNRFQEEVDFTDHLHQGRALLIGKTIKSPGSLLGDEPIQQHATETWVRILLPVTPKKAGNR